MKTFKFSIVLLILIIVASFVYTISLQNASNKIIDHIVSTQKFVQNDNWDEAYKSSLELESIIEKTEKWLSTLIHHYEIDEINISYSKLKEYVAFKDKTNFFAESEALKLLISHLPKKESLNFGNFF